MRTPQPEAQEASSPMGTPISRSLASLEQHCLGRRDLRFKVTNTAGKRRLGQLENVFTLGNVPQGLQRAVSWNLRGDTRTRLDPLPPVPTTRTRLKAKAKADTLSGQWHRLCTALKIQSGSSPHRHGGVRLCQGRNTLKFTACGSHVGLISVH